jgi:hypothetical protein
MKARQGGLSFDFLVTWHTLFEVHLQIFSGFAGKRSDGDCQSGLLLKQ